uniref:START domain-containing protein n=1 Tax=Syphacia muris TaxID=451379 RepID=A0A158R3W2_9BILA
MFIEHIKFITFLQQIKHFQRLSDTMTSYTVAGLTDVLSPENEQYAEALDTAGKAMEDVLTVLKDPGFETMEGWKKKKDNKDDVVYSKRFPFGKVFTLRAIMNASREEIFSEHWDNFVETAKLSKNTSLAEKVAILTPHVEIIHYAMKDSGLVKGRDFVTSRMYRRVDDVVLEAARSCEKPEIERYKKKTRGNLLLGGGRFQIHPEDPQKTIVDYMVALDFKGPDLTKPVVESTICKFILQDVQWAREHIAEKKKTA